jgi:HEAT repeat protein
MARSSFPPPAAVFPCRFGMVIVAAVLPGCAQSKSWMPPMPWQSTTSAEERRERYGLTANERVKALEKQANEARAAGTAAETAFTTDLAHALLAEHDPRVRSEIVRLAAGFDTPSALAICRGALEDPDERVRKAACDAWGGRGGPEAVTLLTHRYETDTDIDVRLRAVRMLGGVKDQAAIPALARALEDSDPAVQYRAVAALRQVSGRDLGDDVNRWRAWAADPGSEPEWSVAETFRKLF